MIRVLALALAPPPGERHSSAQQALSTLAAERWSPAAAQVQFLILARRWWHAADEAERAAQGFDAAVLFAGEPAGREAEVAASALNEADPALRDADGVCWPGFELAPRAALTEAASLPVHPLARALDLAGLPARVDVHGRADVANRIFHALLSRGASPRVALIRLPRSAESARAEGGRAELNRMQLLEGVKAALAFAAAAAEACRADAA